MANSPFGAVPSLRVDKAVHRGAALQFTVDDQPVDAFAGESVAAALFAAGCRELRQSPRDSAPRGMFCMMGSCQECLVWIGQRQVPACQVPVAAGLAVETLSYRRQHLD